VDAGGGTGVSTGFGSSTGVVAVVGGRGLGLAGWLALVGGGVAAGCGSGGVSASGSSAGGASTRGGAAGTASGGPSGTLAACVFAQPLTSNAKCKMQNAKSAARITAPGLSFDIEHCALCIALFIHLPVATAP
jgi:hypothetical protein